MIRTSSNTLPNFIHLELAQPACFEYKAIDSSDIYILTAAISSPDIYMSKHDYAWSDSVVGTSVFINTVIAHGGRVIFFSSNTVYGERNDALDERALCNPAGEYAVMKHAVEQRFAGNANFKSVRLSYVFSRENKFSKYLIGCAELGEEADLFHPFCRAIIHRDDVVAGSLVLAERWDEFPQQTFYFGRTQVLSRIDFAECLKQVALPNLGLRVTQPDDAFFSNRPRLISMSSPIFPKLLGKAVTSLREVSRQ